MADEDIDAIIRVRDITVQFGKTRVLDGLNLDVKRGEILGFVGPSGAGKSVLTRTIIGLVPKVSAASKCSASISMPPTRRSAAPSSAAGASCSSRARCSPRSRCARTSSSRRANICGSRSGCSTRSWWRSSVMVGLKPEVADRYPSELSGGMIKRVALARALALDPELVFLDEPTSGLDPIGAGDFDELVRTLQRTLGLTVFMVTHDLDSLYTACDRIAVLGNGKIIAAGSIADMKASQHPWLQQYFNGKRARAVSGPSMIPRRDQRFSTRSCANGEFDGLARRLGCAGAQAVLTRVFDGNAGELRLDRSLHAGGDRRGVRLRAVVPEPAHHQAAQPVAGDLRRAGVGPAQWRQCQFQWYSDRGGRLGQARQPAPGGRAGDDREQRPAPQGHPGRSRIPGPHRRRRDLARRAARRPPRRCRWTRTASRF